MLEQAQEAMQQLEVTRAATLPVESGRRGKAAVRRPGVPRGGELGRNLLCVGARRLWRGGRRRRAGSEQRCARAGLPDALPRPSAAV